MNTPVEQFIAERRLEDPSFGGLLAKGFALLRCFIDEPQPLGNGELAQRLQLPARHRVAHLPHAVRARLPRLGSQARQYFVSARSRRWATYRRLRVRHRRAR